MKLAEKLMRALYEEIMLGSAYTPSKFMSNQAPYRFTRAYGKRSNWVNAKRRNAR